MFAGIIWIEHTGDIFSGLSFPDSAEVIAPVELIEVELVVGSGAPQTKVVCVISIITWNWRVVSLGYHKIATSPFGPLFAVIPALFDVASKPDWIYDIRALDFPWVTSFEPIVRNLNLFAIFDLLLENSIIVSYAITPSWNLKSRKTV